jgi:hypothetical protein
MPTPVFGKTFLAGLAINWHVMSRYIVKHRAKMLASMAALGMSTVDIAAVDAAFTAILAVDAVLKTWVGY